MAKNTTKKRGTQPKGDGAQDPIIWKKIVNFDTPPPRLFVFIQMWQWPSDHQLMMILLSLENYNMSEGITSQVVWCRYPLPF